MSPVAAPARGSSRHCSCHCERVHVGAYHRRLALALSNSQLEVIGQARTLSTIDRPDQLGGLIADVAHTSVIGRLRNP